MKAILLVGAALFFLQACTTTTTNDQTIRLQAQIDSLRQDLKKGYSPGTGELMSNIQLHHTKLWFAGSNGSWPLAEYQESLIRSGFKKVQLYHSQKPEAQLVAMIEPAMDSVEAAIHAKDKAAFIRQYQFMTSSCNSCHQATKHPFNIIKIPKLLPIDDQQY
jgi:cytochrome c1